MATRAAPLRSAVVRSGGVFHPAPRRPFHTILPRQTLHASRPRLRPGLAYTAAFTSLNLPVSPHRHLARTFATITSTPPTPQSHDALVIGAGPGGLTAVACLLDNGASSVAWCDPHFLAGRWGENYGEVPSNTKVALFLDFVKASPFLSQLVAEAERPNAYTFLEGLEQDKGCMIRHAADLVVFLAQQMRLKRKDRVRLIDGRVLGLDLARKPAAAAAATKADTWTATISGETGTTSLLSPRVVLATGSAPVTPPHPALPILNLDTALTPTKLARHLSSPTSPRSLAVVGSSHSAILALKNITDLAPHRAVTHFYRQELRFAEYMPGWILYDNTGLKGMAADWARNVYPTLEQIKKVRLPGAPTSASGSEVETEAAVYARELDAAEAEAVYAVGFRPIPRPRITVDGEPVANPAFDNLSGAFDLPGLFGCGIAFPERVTDPRGNVEHAVGMFKFMRFLKRVSPSWM